MLISAQEEEFLPPSYALQGDLSPQRRRHILMGASLTPISLYRFLSAALLTPALCVVRVSKLSSRSVAVFIPHRISSPIPLAWSNRIWNVPHFASLLCARIVGYQVFSNGLRIFGKHSGRRRGRCRGSVCGRGQGLHCQRYHDSHKVLYTFILCFV